MLKVKINDTEKTLSQLAEYFNEIGFNINLDSLKCTFSKSKGNFRYKFLYFENNNGKWACSVINK